MKIIIIVLILVSVFSAPIESFAATGPFFKTSSNSVTYGKPLTVSWSVTNATECYLYSPMSTESNKPDIVSVTGKKVLYPSAVASDFWRGKKATLNLSCVDTTQLNKDGNFTQVYTQHRVVKLTKPKTLDSVLTVYVPQTDETILVNPPRKWTQEKDVSNLQISYSFRDLKRSGSMTLVSVDSFSEPGNGLQITNKKTDKRIISGLYGIVTQYDFQGMRYYIVQLSNGVRKYELAVEVPLTKVSSQWAPVMQSVDTIRIVSGKLDK